MVKRDAVDESTTEQDAARPVRRHALAVGLLAASALVVGIGVGPAGALDRIPGPWHRDDMAVRTTNAEREDRTEHSTCDAATSGAPAPTTTAPAPTGAASVSQTVTVVVPPTVRVESDADGVVRVITNAARPPAPGDHVYRLQANGDYAPADAALVARVMDARWADGSWCSTTAVHRSVTADSDGYQGDGRADR